MNQEKGQKQRGLQQLSNPYYALPTIEFRQSGVSQEFYDSTLKKKLEKLLAQHVYQVHPEGKIDLDKTKQRLQKFVPFLTLSESCTPPCHLSLFLISKRKIQPLKFLFDVLSNWIVAGETLNIPLFFSADFRVPSLSEEFYTFTEVVLEVKDPVQLQELYKSFHSLEQEMLLGISSAYYAYRIQELKGVSPDQKIAVIHEHLHRYIRWFPRHFDYSLFAEMQHVLVMCKDNFKQIRETRHLARIIALTYIFRQELIKIVREDPDRRHLFLRLIRTRLHPRFGERKVLGMLIAVNLLSTQELFEEKHILRAVHNYIPDVHCVDGSYFFLKHGSENLMIVYAEIEKDSGDAISVSELRHLQRDLPMDLKDRVETLVSPVFLPRNEEEVMRNILSLSDQIKYVRDLPQVFIAFDEQTQSHLYFTILFVRVLLPKSQKLQDVFQKSDTFLEFIPDSAKPIGVIRKKYVKEATVFRVKLFKDMFLRDDHSVDLYKARLVVATELERVVGAFRDFNGGMIVKQHELLIKVRNALADVGILNDFLLENFFYSITPASMRSVFDPEAVKQLFIMMMDRLEKGIPSGERQSLTIEREPNIVFVMIATDSRELKDDATIEISKLNISPTDLASTYVQYADVRYMGYIYFSDNTEQQERFCKVLQDLLRKPLRSIRRFGF